MYNIIYIYICISNILCKTLPFDSLYIWLSGNIIHSRDFDEYDISFPFILRKDIKIVFFGSRLLDVIDGWCINDKEVLHYKTDVNWFALTYSFDQLVAE